MPVSDPAMLSLLFAAAVCLPALVCALLLHRLLRAQRAARSPRRRRLSTGRRLLRSATLRARRRPVSNERRADAFVVAGAHDDYTPRARRQVGAPATPDADEPRHAAPLSAARDAEFRHALVVLMFDALECWERNGGTRITLAERSGIWHVTCDDGRLRVRSMERYLSPARLPKQPRWRDVLRSAHYVLSHAPLSDADRARVLAAEEKVRTLARRRAFGAPAPGSAK